MTQIIRMFADRDAAMEAVRALVRAGFSRYDIHVVSPPDLEQGEPESDRLAGIAAMIYRGDVPREKAVIYALGVNKGGSLVVVTPHFGTASAVIKILDAFPTIETGYQEPAPKRLVLDKAAPFSSLLRWPTLSGNPTPFSDLMNLPIGTKTATPFSSWLGWKTLSSEAAPFSKYFGMKTLSDNPAPFSSWLKWPTLSGSAAPFSERFNWRILSGSATPFSDWLKWPTLSNNPAPFSSWLKWPVLSKKED